MSHLDEGGHLPEDEGGGRRERNALLQGNAGRVCIRYRHDDVEEARGRNANN